MTAVNELHPAVQTVIRNLYNARIRGRISTEGMHSGAFVLACWEFCRRHFPAGDVQPDDLANALRDLDATDRSHARPAAA